jgi:atonal protein 8
MSSLLERDAGFCSGSSEHEDDLSRDGTHSPTDASEDSVEVKVIPIGLAKNKRKSKEPLRVVAESELGPLKKRVRFDTSKSINLSQQEENERKSHFRPWAPASFAAPANPNHVQTPQPQVPMPNPADLLARHPGVTTLHRAIKVKPTNNFQDEPLALVAKKQTSRVPESETTSSIPAAHHRPEITIAPSTIHERLQQLLPIASQQNPQFQMPQHHMNFEPPGTYASSNSSMKGSNQSRNYKNMTRERRIEANARERTRVHTISAAFDTLRQSVPSYSNTQKLSKLSVLRIACSYILTLSRMAGEDYSEDHSEPALNDCVDSVTKTIQVEGKIRKKKDE